MTRLKIFFTFALLGVVAQGVGAWTGSGSEADPYQISTADDWNTLCTNVNNGSNTYSGKYFLMTRDISVSRMVGTHSSGGTFNAFQGTLDVG